MLFFKFRTAFFIVKNYINFTPSKRIKKQITEVVCQDTINGQPLREKKER